MRDLEENVHLNVFLYVLGALIHTECTRRINYLVLFPLQQVPKLELKTGRSNKTGILKRARQLKSGGLTREDARWKHT